jgi:hypothetical protein
MTPRQNQKTDKGLKGGKMKRNVRFKGIIRLPTRKRA